MTPEYSWPADPDGHLAQRARHAWAATTAALPIGRRVTGEVIGRQPFGVFVRINEAPDAIGLAEVTTMPPGMALPDRETSVVGDVIGHADHNHQVRLKWVGAAHRVSHSGAHDC